MVKRKILGKSQPEVKFIFLFLFFQYMNIMSFLNNILDKLLTSGIKQIACNSAAQAQPTAGICAVIKQHNSVTPKLSSLLTSRAVIIQPKPLSPGEAAHLSALQIPAACSGFNCIQQTRRRRGNSHGWQKGAEEVFYSCCLPVTASPQKSVINWDTSRGGKDAQGAG